jgi:hypothetical protein
MAWIFVLGIECGPDRAAADALAAHFKPFSLTLSDGTVVSADGAGVLPSSDEAGSWWTVLSPHGLSRTGISTEQEARQCTEAGHHLYHLLRSAPPLYRAAIVGVEAYDFFDLPHLAWCIANRPLHGLVLSSSLHDSFGRPPHFQPFSNGYLWRPYQGEPWPPA